MASISELEPHAETSPPVARSSGYLYAAIGLALAIAAADVLVRGMTASVLYAIPLILLARSGYVRRLRRIVVLLLVADFISHFVKTAFWSTTVPPEYLDFRLVNRTFVAVMLLLLAFLLECWQWTERIRLDFELSESWRREEDENDETLAVVICLPLMLGIFVVDLLSPANYNLAILYLVPLVVCVWMRRPRILWAIVGLAAVLAAMDLAFGAPVTNPKVHFLVVVMNRCVAMAAMALVAAMLHRWLRDDDAATAGWRTPAGSSGEMPRYLSRKFAEVGSQTS